MKIIVEPSDEADLDAIAAIYARPVLEGTASFEEAAPGPAELGRRRRAVVDAGGPHLVARSEGRVVGYAYAGAFRPRPAYRHTLEDSVYIAADMQGRGVGRLLLTALIEQSAAAGFQRMIAIVGDPDVNAASVALHERLGFHRAGRLEGVGRKFDRWLDIALLQRPLGD